MLEILRNKLFGSNESKNRAKSRLHFVLVQDRTGLTGDDMAEFKKELMDVIDKYFVVDKTGFDVDYKREADSTTLLINSPVVVRRQDVAPGNRVGSGKKAGKRRKGKAAAAV